MSGAGNAVSIAKTLVTTPRLVNTDFRQGALYALDLQVETNQKRASAEVSESLVIAQNSKQYVDDNIAVGSTSWTLTGYIKGNESIEPINYFQPFVKFNTDILWTWFQNGAVLTYTDGDVSIHKNVVIKDLQTSQVKDSANAVAFTMTLKKINTMDTGNTALGTFTNGILKAIPQAGGILGQVINLGVTIASRFF